VKLAIKKGTTSKRVMVFIQDSTSTTGAGKTGLTSASVTCYYCREDDGDVGGTAVSLVSATRGTWTSGGFVEKDATNQPGFYEVGLPNAALVTGADWVNFHIKGTGIAMLPLELQLTDNTIKDVYDRIGAPAGASLAADVAAVEAQTDDIGVAGAGLTALGDARLGNLDAAVSTRAPEAAGNVAAIKAKTDHLTFTLANKVDSSIQAAGDFAQAAADKVWATTARSLTSFGTLVADIWAYSTRTLSAFSTALAVSVWDVLESAIITASSIGLKLKTNLDAAITTRSSHSAADVWAVGARTLTSFGTLVADIWAYATRSLTDKAGFYLAAGQLAVKKNAALENFQFLMVDSTDHITPKTGLTVTAERLIDDGVFGACANAVVEVASGIYRINLAATDLNGKVITLKFTAAGADARSITLVTQA